MRMLLFIGMTMFLLLSGCDEQAGGKYETAGCSGEDCRLVYDGVQYFTYDTKVKSSTGKLDSTENEFQYRLPGNDEYVTSGNSITNEFKILKMVNERFQTVYEHKNDQEALFPVGVMDEQYIFAVMEYSEDQQTFKGLFQLNEEDELEQLKTEKNEKTESIFGVGISSENHLFLLLNEEDKQNVYQTDLSLSTFELVAEDISQNISARSGEVCYVKAETFFCGREAVKELEEGTVFAWAAGSFIVEVDDSGGFEVREIADQRLVQSGSHFLGFDVDGSSLTIYSDGNVYELEG
ncbi:hypothetical protein HF072_04810 [Bacillus sp. RO3]|nr:hypothetical protein [Bacillus sp. RO3]